jgi:hypothetical protein
VLSIEADGGLVNFSWVAPASIGPCSRLSFEIVSGSTVLVTNISGCVSNAVVWLPQSCDQTYSLVLQSHLVLPDGSRGPTCSAASAALPLRVSTPPSQPVGVAANVVRSTRIDVQWLPPTNVGGCDTWFFTLNLTNDKTGQLVTTETRTKDSQSADLTSINLDPTQQYTLTIATTAATGTSPLVVLPLSGAVGQVCNSNSTGSIYEGSFIYTRSFGSTCSVYATCRGSTPGFLPQVTYVCQDGGYDASFWYWSVAVRSASTTASYIMSQPGQPALFGSTTESFVFFEARDTGSAPQPTYVVNTSSTDPAIAPVFQFNSECCAVSQLRTGLNNLSELCAHLCLNCVLIFMSS